MAFKKPYLTRAMLLKELARVKAELNAALRVNHERDEEARKSAMRRDSDATAEWREQELKRMGEMVHELRRDLACAAAEAMAWQLLHRKTRRALHGVLSRTKQPGDE